MQIAIYLAIESASFFGYLQMKNKYLPKNLLEAKILFDKCVK